MNSDMQFSRGFSKPIFRLDLVPDFIAALRAIGLPDWVLVREKLYTPYADQVIELLVLYKDAFVAREASEKVWYVTQKPYPLDHASERVLAKVYDSKRKEQLAYDALCQVLSQQTDFKEYTQHAADWDLATKLI